MSDDTTATPAATGEPKKQVDPSELQPQDAISEKIFELRDEIKVSADSTKVFADKLKDGTYLVGQDSDNGEMIANSILAFRHLEDAAMRLGKVMQAKNGGVSILSK